MEWLLGSPEKVKAEASFTLPLFTAVGSWLQAPSLLIRLVFISAHLPCEGLSNSAIFFPLDFTSHPPYMN